MRLLALAGLLAAAGCAAPTRVAAPPATPRLAAAPPVVPLERETRYYTDEQGTLWDDRGRKVSPGR